MNLKELILKRKANESDMNFVMDCWFKGLRKKMLMRGIDNAIFAKRFKKMTDGVLAKSKIDVVCMKDDPEIILGFVIYRDDGPVPIISFWYVKSAYRGQGIGTLLINKLIGEVSVATMFSDKLGGYFEKHKIVYDPFYDLPFWG